MDRYRAGKVEYGAFTFLQNPTLEMAMEELADLANYARFTYIKVALIRDTLMRAQADAIAKMNDSVGGFVSTRDLLGGKM